MKRLDYSIVIATRNRPSALRLSVPRMLNQSRQPAQLIVVDSSDDHPATVAAVRESVGGHPVELIILPAERGLTRQRNLGIRHVTSPVVFFPDDDSIWFPGVAEAQMEVYEKDVGERISAVCAAESDSPPPDWRLTSSGSYQMSLRHRFQQRIAGKRARFQHALFPDPAKMLGRSYWPQAGDTPSWFTAENVSFVEYMTGFRMSFRTEVIRQVRFDEVLTQYSLCEDIDASFGAWGLGWVVAAHKAKVYHYRSPEARGDDSIMGITRILNKAYVIVKRTQPGDCFRRTLEKFTSSKRWIAGFTNHGSSGKSRLDGMKAAALQLPTLLNATPDEAAVTYKQAVGSAISQIKH